MIPKTGGRNDSGLPFRPRSPQRERVLAAPFLAAEKLTSPRKNRVGVFGRRSAHRAPKNTPQVADSRRVASGRGYKPASGRACFLNQDPIAEQGGLNLYAFCGNNGVNKYDYMGHGPRDGDDAAPTGGYDKETSNWLTRFYGGISSLFGFGSGSSSEAAERTAQATNPINSGSLIAHSQAVGFAPASPNNNPTAPSVASEAWNAAVSGGIDFLRTPFDALAYVGEQIDRATDAAAYALGRNNLVDPTMAKGALNALTIFGPQIIAGTTSLVSQVTKQVSTALRIGEGVAEIAAANRATSVIGSMSDVAAYKGLPGLNILERPKGLPDAEFGRYNAEWMNTGLRNGNDYLVVTNPVAHTDFLEGIRAGLSLRSNYLTIEIDMLEQFGVTTKSELTSLFTPVP